MKAKTKKIFIVLLSVIVAALLAVGICFAAASSDDKSFSADTDEHTAETLSSHSSHGSSWSTISSGSNTLSSGNYYLSANRTAAITISSGESVTLCLNGKTLTASSGGPAIYMERSATLEICDCQSSQGSITGGTGHHPTSDSTITYGGAIYMYANNTLTITEGKIHGNSAYDGGAIYASGSCTINIKGGSIYDNECYVDSSGMYYGEASAIHLTGTTSNWCTFNMSGGEIYNNYSCVNASSAKWGGGTVFLRCATSTISGGSIHDNVIDDYSTVGGGAVAVSYGSLTVSGGEMYNNTASLAGAIYVSSADFSMTGGKIYNNTATGNFSSGYGGAIYYYGASGYTFKMSGGEIYGNNGTNGGGIYIFRILPLRHFPAEKYMTTQREDTAAEFIYTAILHRLPPLRRFPAHRLRETHR